MASIKSLPESIRSSVRSGIVIFDVTRVVEELIFNSLDAGASKVSVFVGVGTCYVKVVDDGSGITRDGLVLLGERYATSKFEHLAKKCTESGSFGFRGEALASISDVSLLEIVTKACGRPNGYRKVMKGRKCLYLGIDDDRKDAGTTVVVRDLFYNQPVRRKYIQSSPKKVLQSIKKCVLRIALVHLKVSFKVVDIESEDVLLSTHSSSPLSLLNCCFGIDVSTSLHELNISDGKVKLSGYVSGPCDNLTTKAFQYVYINLRFISKGPIHKLVNQLATRFESCNLEKVVDGSQSRKRSRPQAYPAFILNISCPRSFYDLTFEPSKTYVVFKDWVPVLELIDEAIQQLWKKKISYVDVLGESTARAADKRAEDLMLNEDDKTKSAKDLLDEDFPVNSRIGKNKSRMQNHQASLDFFASPFKMLTKEDSCLSHREQDLSPIRYSHKYADHYKEQESDIKFVCQTDNSFQSWDDPLAKCVPKVSRKRENQHYISDNNFLSHEDYFFVNEVSTTERSNDTMEGDDFTSLREKDSFVANLNVRNGSAAGASSCDRRELRNHEMRKNTKRTFLKSCSSRGSIPSESITEDLLDFQTDDFKTKQILSGPYDRVDISETDSSNKNYGFLSRSLWLDRESSFEPFPCSTAKSELSTEYDGLHRDFERSIPSYDEHLDEDDCFSSGPVTNVKSIGSGHQTLDLEWCSLTSSPLSQAATWDFTDIDMPEECCRSFKTASSEHFLGSEGKDCRFSYDVLSKASLQDNCAASCSNRGVIYGGSSQVLQRQNFSDKLSPECPDILTTEANWFSFDLQGKSQMDAEIHKRQRDSHTYRESKFFHILKGRLRSHSAPPFCRAKRRFFSLNNHLTARANDAPDSRSDMKNIQDLKEEKKDIQKDEKSDSLCFDIQDTAPLKEIHSTELHESLNSWSKWRDCCPQTANKNKLCDMNDQNNILDISSGFLHLASEPLIPESINKNFLVDAKVLQQVDKKFIPVVAGRILALVDQHAADERIRLEELRQKVLSGEEKTITFLDVEQELMLPEIGYQLLHNYAETIKRWGWICNIHAQDSWSFKRTMSLLHKQPTIVTLTAVPRILGVNLSDADLMEFLQQLDVTDGSSKIPPAVLRILNSKACRSAIMFGDSLLPSECSLIIEELKQTSLCFQCAHGRPTTAPLVNLEALHKQLAKISLLNDRPSYDLWHGLRRHQISLERAALRLKSS
ncbi:hypothetical protein UlMin_045599 [Ulmus minor]